MQDFNQAWAFVAALAGDPSTAICDFRAIHDTDRGVAGLPRRGLLSEVWPELTAFNNQGYGVFMVVNALDGQGRELHNVAYARTHFIDLDAVDAPARFAQACQWSPVPAFAVSSSANKYHVYWPVAPYLDNERYTTVQRKLRTLFGGDRSVVDPTRVMRLPGTFNHKYGTPSLVTVGALTGYGQPLTVEQIEAALAHVQVIDGGEGVRHDLGDPEQSAPSLAWVERALQLVDPNTMSRGDWISFSAAIKQAGWNHTDPDSLFALWSNWCARYDGNDTAENLKQWKSIRNTEVGWPSILKRVPALKLVGTTYAPTPPTGAPVAAPVIEPPPLGDTSGEFLDEFGCKEWFKGCTLIERTGDILVPTGRFMKPQQFNARYGGKRFIFNQAGKDTDEPWKAATRSTLWTVPKADHIRFLPEHGWGEIITDQLGRKGVNTFMPIIMKRRAGDPSPWLNHLAAMLPDPNDQKIVLDYLAHNVKYLGYKIPWSPLIQSTEGTGKGFIQETMESILGEMYCYSPKAQELVKSGSTFNAWMRAKLLIVVNEIKVDERRDLVEILKPMITDKRVEIQSKGIDQEMEDNCANWIFFSNFKDAIPISSNGRRWAVFYSAMQSKADLLAAGMDDRYFHALFNWLRSGGSEIMADYFLNYPIERGAIGGKAPDTSSKNEALALSLGPVERMIFDATADNRPGFRNGWVSVAAVGALQRNKGGKVYSDGALESILMSMGYHRIGRSLGPMVMEHSDQPTTLFNRDKSAQVVDYAASQGY